MEYTKGEWKRYGRHIHINTNNTSDEIAGVLCPGWMPREEAQANAHLIAAAPDMYEALKEITELAPRAMLKLPYAIQAVEIAEKALAKAEGKYEK